MGSGKCFLQAGNTYCHREKVFPWFVYKDWNSFKDIEPVKEIINSISVFGNPPKSFIDECHRNHIEVYQAVGGSEENISTPEKIKTLVDGYVDACNANGYDGIDWDFEHLSPDVQDTYTGFWNSLHRNSTLPGRS